jgi:adenylate kinase family enzyme
MDKQTVVFIGRSGCGKGTQAKKLIEYLETNDPKKRSVLYIATGALFRDFIQGDTHTQKLSRERYEASGLQPTFLSTYLWGKELVEKEMGNEHIVFDGLPRTRSESKILSSVFDFYERPSPAVAYLNVSEEWTRERLKSRGREDDLDDIEVKRRMAWFETDVWPAIEYFKEHDGATFVDVNGEQEIEEVHQEVIRKLNL